MSRDDIEEFRNIVGVLLVGGEQTDVGHAEAHGGGAAARHVERLETFLRDDARVHRIGNAGGEDEPVTGEQAPQGPRRFLGHRGSFLVT